MSLELAQTARAPASASNAAGTHLPPLRVFVLRAAVVAQRIGKMRTTVVGLLTMTIGCLLSIPASLSESLALPRHRVRTATCIAGRYAENLGFGVNVRRLA